MNETAADQADSTYQARVKMAIDRFLREKEKKARLYRKNRREFLQNELDPLPIRDRRADS